MAHFAELDQNNVVLRVIVVDNKDCADASGVEKEHIGAAFCERLFGGIWKQTSYGGKMRGRYAGIGYTYDATLDEFVAPVGETIIVAPVGETIVVDPVDTGNASATFSVGV